MNLTHKFNWVRKVTLNCFSYMVLVLTEPSSCLAYWVEGRKFNLTHHGCSLLFSGVCARVQGAASIKLRTRIRAFSLPSSFPSAGHCPDLSVLAEYARHVLSEMEIQGEMEEGRVGKGIRRERTHIMI